MDVEEMGAGVSKKISNRGSVGLAPNGALKSRSERITTIRGVDFPATKTAFDRQANPTETAADDGSNKDIHDISGRFVEFIFELVQQMKSYAPRGVFPKSRDAAEKNTIGRYIKQVRSSQTKRRSK